METLSTWFEQFAFHRTNAPVIITVIGSGGKTSLIEHLAKNLTYGNRKTLVTATTKMLPISAIPGVTQIGVFNDKSGKFESLPLAEIERLSAGYDLVLIEGDGSRRLPLKGWADYEPVTPAFTTITVGVIPVWPLGQAASVQIIHRLEQFCKLSGAKQGETVKYEHLAAIITNSLFARVHGERVLFFSQIEDEKSLAAAREITAMLQPAFRSTFSGIIAASTQQNKLTLFT